MEQKRKLARLRMEKHRNKTNPNRKRRERHGYAAGLSKSPEYICWLNMKRRCLKPGRDYRYYGGRGIRLWEPWAKSFKVFLEYVGSRPGPGYSIDRIDNEGHYVPGNVRWATRSEQMKNRRRWKLAS